MGGPSVRQFVQTPGLHVTPNVDYQKVDVDSPAMYRRSVLDFVMDDTHRLETGLGPTDRRKLDEYLSSIREVERQLEKAEKENKQIDPHMDKPYGVPADFAEHFRLMYNMIAIAFQADQK